MKKSYEQQAREPYIMTYFCFNCKQNYSQEFPFGVRAKQGICTRCGVDAREESEMKLFNDLDDLQKQGK